MKTSVVSKESLLPKTCVTLYCEEVETYTPQPEEMKYWKRGPKKKPWGKKVKTCHLCF